MSNLPWEHKNRAPRELKQKRKEDFFYRSSQFRKIRGIYIKGHPWCEVCDFFQDVEPGKVLEHLVPIEQGGSRLATDNFMTVCTFHANQKSGKESHRGCLIGTIEVDGELLPKRRNEIFEFLTRKPKVGGGYRPGKSPI